MQADVLVYSYHYHKHIPKLLQWLCHGGSKYCWVLVFQDSKLVLLYYYIVATSMDTCICFYTNVAYMLDS